VLQVRQQNFNGGGNRFGVIFNFERVDIIALGKIGCEVTTNKHRLFFGEAVAVMCNMPLQTAVAHSQIGA